MKKWIISCILLSTIILSAACSSGASTNSEYNEPPNDVHSIIEDMEERISELESQNEDLQYELEDVESRLTDVELNQDLDF